MKFGNQLSYRKNKLWTEFYFNYEDAKNLLTKLALNLEDSLKTNEIVETFEKFLTEELKKVNDWYCKMEIQCFQTQKELKEQYSVSDIYDKTHQATIAEFSEFLVSLKDFGLLNHMAFTKIIKKYQKTLKVSTKFKDDFINSLNNSYFRNSKEIETILIQIHPLLLYGKVKPPTDSIKTPINLPDDPTIINELSITSLERNKFYHFLYNVSTDGLGQPIFIPIIVCRGKKKGPILGITSAIHGNEINGVPLIHKLMAFIDPNILIGTVVAIPVFNGPGFLKKQKNFIDGVDLNTIFPGKPNGTPSQVYVYRMFENIIKQVEYLIDLHTAGFGEINSLFAFANMKDGLTSRLALLQSPQIIIHEKSETNTLRGACNKAGIKSITLGIGNPLSFQKKYVKHALIGVQNIMGFLKMIPYASIKENLITAPPTLCTSAFWMYTDVGGVLTVFPEVNVWVKKGEVVARVRDLFGNVVREYKAPCDGIVIGKNSNPPNQSGEKILYLGLSEDPKKFQ